MKYQLTSQQIASKVADEVVILNYDKGAYYGLDEVGAFVWSKLEEGPQTIDALCESVSGAYDIEQSACRDDIDALLNELISEKLVELTN